MKLDLLIKKLKENGIEVTPDNKVLTKDYERAKRIIDEALNQEYRKIIDELKSEMLKLDIASKVDGFSYLTNARYKKPLIQVHVLMDKAERDSAGEMIRECETVLKRMENKYQSFLFHISYLPYTPGEESTTIQ